MSKLSEYLKMVEEVTQAKPVPLKFKDGVAAEVYVRNLHSSGAASVVRINKGDWTAEDLLALRDWINAIIGEDAA